MKKTIYLINAKFIVTATLLFASITILNAQQAGIPDPSFGTKGAVVTKIAADNNDNAQSIAVTADNKIVVIGNSFNAFGYSNIAVVRYAANGTLDKSFNGTGKKIINSAFCNVVLIQPDQKILIGGSNVIGSNSLFALWRLNSNGSIDNTFGVKGYQTVAFGGVVVCFTMKLQSDGKILIAGNDGNFYSGNSSLIIARLNTNGQLDNSFSGDGKFSLNLAKKSLTCNEILVQPNGDIIAAGQLDTIVRPNFRFEFFATRLHSDGNIDPSFGINGMIRNKNSVSDVSYCAGLLPDGRIVMSGYSKVTGVGNVPSVLCLTANGNVDKTFGTNGWMYPPFYGASGQMNSAAVQTNGKIIFAGCIFNYLGISSAGIVRLNGNGTVDKTFAVNGVDTFSTAGGAIVINDATLQKDGKLLITGYISPSPNNLYTRRFLADPQLIADNIEKVSIQKASVNSVLIKPNPVTDKMVRLNLDLKISCQVSINIYALNGKKIIGSVLGERQAGIYAERIQLPESTSPGTYACEIILNGEKHVIKFLVQ